jgi:hypothetical protein
MKNQEVKITTKEKKNKNISKKNEIITEENKMSEEEKMDSIHKENFINGLKNKLINKEQKYHNAEHIITKIDDMNVIVYIEYSNYSADNIKYFKVMIQDKYLSSNNNTYHHLFYAEHEKGSNRSSYHHFNIDNENEMNYFWNLLKNLKTYKYNKITSTFEHIGKMDVNKKYNDSIEYLFDSEICCVCNDKVGYYERIQCNHFLCKKCAQQMIKRKNVQCPICREKCVHRYKDEQIDSDDDIYDE